MSPTLPTEILETVIDATRNDRKTLAACGAAGRQLLVRSRVHLFAEVVLGSPSTNPTRHQSTLHTLYPSSPTRCDLLWELVEANPTLTRHVTKLTLSEGAEPNVTMYWISQSTTLVPIVRCLSNLRVFTLREGQGSQWSPVLIQAMHLCFHAPLIESVELAGLYVTELPSLFAIFSTSRPGMALQKLGLSNLMIRDVPLGNEQLGQRERNLRAVYTLDISSPHQRDSQRPVFGLFSRSPPLINLSRLHHLGLTIGDDLWLVSQWIDLVAASLVQLHLKFKRGMLNVLFLLPTHFPWQITGPCTNSPRHRRRFICHNCSSYASRFRYPGRFPRF
ncbi:hypothetical protein B0H19DRAFT_1100301 [Mycena capillaripes]|nr:hypothetical protein B0H19DRAFT_1100301 [Mycena capillaripes]